MTAVNTSSGTPSPWTDERIAALKQYWDDGYIAEFIAVQLGGGITKSGVLGKAMRLGLPKRKNAPLRGKRAHRMKPKARSLNERLPFRAVPLPDLQPGQCRFPHGDGPFVFCGQPAAPGSSYCEHHHSICYGRTPSRFVPVKRNVHAANWRAA